MAHRSSGEKLVGLDETTFVDVYPDNSLKSTSQIIGNDGLYKAYVDSVGRLAVNANVTFPEVVYRKEPLYNGTSPSMNVNGLSPNVNFRILPVGRAYYVETISIVISDDSPFQITQFGGMTALANGVQINVRSKGVNYTMVNLQSNEDLYTVFGDSQGSQQIASVLGATNYSYWGSWKLQNRIALDPDLGDYLEFKIRDNLTGLLSFRAYCAFWRTTG